VSLQLRDLEILEAVYTHRVLSSAQIAALFFRSTKDEVNSACRTRLRMLVAEGLLERHEQPVTRAEGRRPFLFMPTESGCHYIAYELGLDPTELDWKPSFNSVRWPFLAHQLAINDLYVTVRRACARLDWALEKWIDDRFLRKSHGAPLQLPGAPEGHVVVPDAYFAVRNGVGLFQFFVEIDRATMAVAPTSLATKSWQRRIQGYQALYDSPVLAKLYDTASIRVLTITTGPRRLLNLKESIEQVGGQRRYWLATTTDVTPATMFTEPVWHVASIADRRALLTFDP